MQLVFDDEGHPARHAVDRVRGDRDLAHPRRGVADRVDRRNDRRRLECAVRRVIGWFRGVGGARDLGRLGDDHVPGLCNGPTERFVARFRRGVQHVESDDPGATVVELPHELRLGRA